MNQKTQSAQFQIRTKSCMKHTWTKPVFDYLATDHFNGEKFFNTLRNPDAFTRKDMLKWIMTRKSDTWKVDRKQEYQQFFASSRSIPHNRPLAKMDDWLVWFVGHATVLIQIGPYNFLTDPVWAEYAGPRQGTGPRRACPAGIALEELPTIHGVLLSHNHYDHMDLATLNWLHEQFAMPIYTGLGNAYYLPTHFNVIELDWWQSEMFEDLRIVYTPAQHGSGRGWRDQNHALWGGFSIVHSTGHFFFAGDTGYAAHFKQIHTRLGAPRVALLPIGAYEPRRLMKYLHMNPEEAFQAHKDLQSKCSLAMHYRTFQLTDEARDQPEHDLHHAMRKTSKLMNPFLTMHEGKKLIV